MSFSEIKTFAISLILLFVAIFVVPNISNATDYTSGSFTVKDPIISSGFQSSSSASFGLGQSLSQLAIGKSASASFQLWSGFQYYYQVLAHTLSATPDDSEVDLAWTVPTTYLGVQVSGYEIGTGTTSGSYTFENVGNVTAYTKTGLTNGQLYYFISRAYGPGGTFLVYSNEVSATPNGVVVPPPPPGGGGSGSSQGAVSLTGMAYPNSKVTILRDSNIISNVTANSSGAFNVVLNNQPTGTYTYTIYATDPNGVRSPSLGFEQIVSKNVTSNINNLVLAPTIQQSHVSVKQGESLTAFGYTAPNVTVTLYFSGQQTFTQTTTSNGLGYYSYTLPSASYQKGQYNVYSRATINGAPSPVSFSLSFSIGDQTTTPPPGTCRRSDLNCDNKVDLVDFSILLYFWDLNDFTRNPRADIDGNGDVGLRDLSIMLYDWTG